MKSVGNRRRNGFTVLEVIIVILILTLIISIGIPWTLENRRLAQGDICCGQLDAIFNAKEQIAYRENIRPDSPTIPVDVEQINKLVHDFDVTEPCPGGGTYIVGDLNDYYGTVVAPKCDMAGDDADDGFSFEELGLHIHRRSYTQSADGRYSRPSRVIGASD